MNSAMIASAIELITNVGFPIACVVVMAWFIYTMFKKIMANAEANMEKVQNRCKEREEILYAEMAKNRETNSKTLEVLAHYVEKLDTIQTDVNQIKTNVTTIMAKQK